MNILNDLTSVAESFPQSLVAGLLCGILLPALGVFVVLRGASFLGVTLAQVSTLGTALGLALGWSPPLSSILLCVPASLGLSGNRFGRMKPDALLGIVFVMSSASAILVVASNALCLHCVQNAFMGDLILCTNNDRNYILATLIPAGIFLAVGWRPLLYASFDREFSQSMSIRIRLWESLFLIITAASVAAAIQVAGTLLIFCFLVVAPAFALVSFRRFPSVIAGAMILGGISCLLGLILSYHFDLPTNPVIAVLSGGLGLLLIILPRIFGFLPPFIWLGLILTGGLFTNIFSPVANTETPSRPESIPSEESTQTTLPRLSLAQFRKITHNAPSGFLEDSAGSDIRMVIPKELQDLDKARVIIRGYPYPVNLPDGSFNELLLLDSPVSCCIADALVDPKRWVLVELVDDPGCSVNIDDFPAGRAMSFEGRLELGFQNRPDLGLRVLLQIHDACLAQPNN